MLEVFAPYLDFIAMFVAIGLNVLLLIKNAHWWAYLIANVLYSLVMVFFGLTPYGFIGEFIIYIVQYILDIVDQLGENIFKWIFGIG